MKSKNLKDSFTRFIKSTKVTLNSSLDIISYAFLIPIIVDIQSLATSDVDVQTISMKIAKRLVASGVVLVGQVVLTNMLKKIIAHCVTFLTQLWQILLGTLCKIFDKPMIRNTDWHVVQDLWQTDDKSCLALCKRLSTNLK